MSNLNPNIILGIQQPNIPNALAQGAQAAGTINAVRENNALAPLRQQSAQLGVEQQRMGLQLTEQQIRQARQRIQQGEREAAAQGKAAQIAEEKAQAAETLRQAILRPDQAPQILSSNEDLAQMADLDPLDIYKIMFADDDTLIQMGMPPEPQSPEGKFEADRRSGLLPDDAQRGSDSAKEEQIARLVSTGDIDRNTAIGIVDGRLAVSRDPITGTAQIVDKATGQIIGAPQQSQSQPGPTQDRADAGQSLNTRTPPQDPMDDGIPRDFGGATGIPGLVDSIKNAGASALGRDLPAPEVENAINTLNALNRDTMVILASGITGRPSNFSMEQIQQFLPTATGIFQGPERTLSRARETRKTIQRDIEATMQVASGEGQFRPQQVAEANQRLLTLRAVAGQWDAIIQGLQSQTPQQGEKKGRTPGGIEFEVIE